MRRRPLVPLLCLLLTAGVTLAAGPARADRSHEHPTVLPGLHAAASVTRDTDGIAHISATDQHDLFFLQGWVHAGDRLFQMDTSRRQASGTLAELLGPGALDSDVQFRTLGLRRAAERSLPVQSADGRAALDAYAAGVNAWVASHPLPAQYAALHLTRFAPWTPVDSLAVGKLIAFGLSFDLDTGLSSVAAAYQAAGARYGFDGAALFSEDLFRSQPFSSASTVPDATAAGAVAPSAAGGRAAAAGGSAAASGGRVAATGLEQQAVPAAALRLARQYQERVDAVPFLAKAADHDFTLGSNEWAIAGTHTASGRPIVANDPHLGLDTPSTFYPVALRSGAIDVQGESFAGAPYVVVGQNRRIAWGATVDPMDVTDTFVERVRPDPTSPSGLSTVYRGTTEHVLAVPETFRVNTMAGQDAVTTVPPGGAIPAATLIVPRRNNGPIVNLDLASGVALSVQYTGFSPTHELDTFRLMDAARDLADFRTALESFDFGSQNWAYADVDGHIAYLASSEMPLREDLEQGFVHGSPPWFLRDGTGGNEWLPATHHYPGQAIPYEILPPQEMPQLVDPPAGFFVNANNDPAGTTLDNNPLNQVRPTGGIYYLNPGYDGFRAGRITEMIRAALASGRRLTAADVRAQQADVTLLDAEFFTPYLTAALAHARASTDPTLHALAADPAVAEAVGRLAGWDFTTPTGIPQGYDASDVDGALSAPSAHEIDASVAATLYAVWRGRYVTDVLDAHLAPYQVPTPGDDESVTALRKLLERFPTRHGVGISGVDFYAVPGVADPADRRDVLLLRSMADALDLLAGPRFAAAFHGSTNQADYRWGLLHRVTFEAVLRGPWSIPPAGGAFPAPLPGLPGVPTDGGFKTVDVANHDVRADSADGFTFDSGPNRRFVAQPQPGGMYATSALPGGTSEDLESPYYANLLPRWLTDDPYPVRLRTDDRARATASVVGYVPG